MSKQFLTLGNLAKQYANAYDKMTTSIGSTGGLAIKQVEGPCDTTI